MSVDVSPPTGTVTFLFTDVEGSTRLWESDRVGMTQALRRHDVIVGGTIAEHDGHVFSTAGDAFSAAFARVADAVACAAAIQRHLHQETWPEGLTLKVRIGLHSGEADERGGDYFGPVVNRAARVMDAGHGGQVLLSDVTATLAEADVVDLGDHLLKSLSEPVHLHQLVLEGLPAVFPPIRSAGAVASTIRPPRTETVGRGEEIAAIVGMLTDSRLVTLVGAGGSGKTRLALEVGNLLVPDFPGGVHFADLSTVGADDLVVPAIMKGLGLALVSGVDATDAVRGRLAGRRTLIIVDNCEHVIDEAAGVCDELMVAHDELRLLVTSREPLSVDGEVVFRVPGLSDAESVALFRSRADTAAGGDDVIVEICRRLDGLPLAIELAAARTSVLSVEEIRGHLDDRFTLLTGGRRRTRGRQQTLEAAVEWSYDLLEPDEQRALRALSVMPASFGLDVAAGVMGVDRMRAISLLDALSSRSLVQSHPDAADPHDRYRLLETIREFAIARLRLAGEDHDARDRHVDAVASVIHDVAFPLIAHSTGDLTDDLVAVGDWLVARGDRERATELAFHVAGSMGISGALDRMSRFVDWASETDVPSRMARMAALAAWTGAFAVQIGRVFRAADEASSHEPGSESAAVAALMRALIVNGTHLEFAAQDLQSSRSVLDPSTEPQAWLFQLYTEQAAALWRDDIPSALALGQEFVALADDLDMGRPLARASQLTALLLADDLAGLEALVESPPPPAGMTSYANWPVNRSADASALAALGRVGEARRLVAELWDTRQQLDIPLVDDGFLIALAYCARRNGETDEARRMLVGNTWFGRFQYDGVLLYRMLSDFEGVPADQAIAWRSQALMDALEHRHVIHAERRTARAIEAELRRLGLLDA